MDDVKIEYKLICNGCLSNNRHTTVLGENTEMFLDIIGNEKYFINGMEDIKLCWECLATVKKFKNFQSQVRKAQDILIPYLYGLEATPILTLSNLKTTKAQNEFTFKWESSKRKKKIAEKEVVVKEEVIVPLDIEGRSNSVISKEVSTNNEILNNLSENIPNIPDKYTNNINIDTIDNEVIDNDLSNIKCEPDLLDNDNDVFDNDNDAFDNDNFQTKKKKFKKSKPIYKQIKNMTTMVDRKTVDWGDLKSYYTTVFLDETEIEQYITVKERRFLDHTRYSSKCDICKVGYKKKVDMERHNNLHHRKPGAQIKCSLCRKTLHSQNELESHWKKHTPMAKCKLCGVIVRPRGLKMHLNCSHTKQYNCCFCTMTFGTLSAFGNHYRDMHMKYICDYCQKEYNSKGRVAHHIRNVHIPAHCNECNRPYINRRQYIKHCVTLHPHLVNKRETKETAFCVECNKQFRSRALYQNHLKTSVKHIEVKPVKIPCPECGKIFARKLYMKNHYNLYHLKKTNFYCELCDKYYSRKSGLRVHNKYVHQKVQHVRDKICDLCGKAFASNRTMLNHRRTHTGERPHKCPYCTAEFIQKYAMKTHIRTQHKQYINAD